MKIAYALLIFVFILVSNNDVASSGTNDINAFVNACVSSSNLGDSICQCLAEKADEKLSPDGFAFLVASMNGNDQETARLRSKLDMNESLEAGMFMVKYSQECAEEVGGN